MTFFKQQRGAGFSFDEQCNCDLMLNFEFNNNSTPLQKVQLFYSTIWNDGFKKRSNINTLRDVVLR